MKEDQAFQNLSWKTADMLNIVTGSGLRYDNDSKERVNMCQAIEDMKKEAFEQGISQGISQGIKVSKYLMKNYTQQKTEDEIINELANEFNISTDYAKMYLDDFLSYFFVLHFLQRKNGLEKLMREDQAFQNLSWKTADMLNIVTGSDFKYDNTKERVTMCQAIEDMKKEAVEQGIKVSKYLMKNYTQQKTKKDIINELVNEFNISTDDAKMYLDDFLS